MVSSDEQAQPRRSRRWFLQIAIVAMTVVGLFAMHGLTMNHDSAMAHGGAMESASAGSPRVGSAHAPHVDVAAEPAMMTTLAGPVLHSAAAFADAADHSAGMGSACVALLSVLVLVLTSRAALAVVRRATRALGATLAKLVERARVAQTLDLVEISVCRT